jgi:cell wall-associated NlpC family hydrolase
MIRGRKTVGALALAGLALWLTKQPAPRDDDVERVAPEPPPPAPQPAVAARRSWRRRAAITLAYTTLFFAGGAVVAGAGNQLAQVDPESTTDAALVGTETTVTDTTTTSTDTDVTTTTDVTSTTEETPTVATTADAVAAPDPSDATPPLAADPGTPAPTPARPAAPAPVRQARRAAARKAAAPVSSPFPVLAFDPQAWLVAHPGTPAGNAAVAIAEQYLGVPYRWGGNTPTTGFDCSGLTQYVYAQLGVWLPHYAAAQFLAYAHVDPTQLEPGDLVFFEPKPDGPGHVAVYAGGDVIVEAPHTGAVVRLGSLSGAAASLGFLGAVRPSAGASTVPVTLQPFALVAPAAASTPGNWRARPS